jgi:hypothetical protein
MRNARFAVGVGWRNRGDDAAGANADAVTRVSTRATHSNG